jgi:hypothetical protein
VCCTSCKKWLHTGVLGLQSLHTWPRSKPDPPESYALA